MARLSILDLQNIKQEILYTIHTRHEYSGVANLMKIESFYSYEQINIRNTRFFYKKTIFLPEPQFS